jgi:MFS family permease
MCIGTAWSLQGLWAAPWLEHVEGLDRSAVVHHLLVMGVALSLGALLLGWGADRLRRRGIRRETFLAVIAIAFIVAQLALAVRAPIPTYISWGLIAAVGAATVLSFAILPEYFPKEMSARANAALNILHLVGAFLLQYVTGVIVSLWPAEAGHPPAEAYQAAVGLGVVLQSVALLWFLVTARAAQAPVFRARPVMPDSAMPEQRVAPIDYATAQFALAHHVAHARSHAAHWRRIGMASAGLCLCLAITLAMTSHSHVFAYVVEAPAGHVAANLSTDEAARGHSTTDWLDEDSIARMSLAGLARWPSGPITAARRADVQRALYGQGP